MPSQSKRLCVFGDSHFACTKLAVDQGLVDAADVEIEFWGNIGKQFRHLTWRNERIEPLDEYTAGRFAMTNAHGREFLSADDFDMIFFMGCRVDVYRLFPEALHRRRTAPMWLSSSVEKRWLADFLHRQPPYQFAVNFAAQGRTQVLVAPVPFDTVGFEETIPDDFHAARDADESDRAQVWEHISEIMARDGISLLRQPEDTVVEGCCTDPQYAVEKYRERQDRTHKNPHYGALILNKALEMLRED